MKRQRIRVKVEFEEIDSENEDLQSDAAKVEDGCFEIELENSLALDIDACEQAVLAANFPAIRDALRVHLQGASKKKPAKRKRDEE